LTNTSIEEGLKRPMIDTTYAVKIKRNTITSPIKTMVKNIESDYEKSEELDSDENDENEDNC